MIERVAAGLRKMNNTPDYMLYVDGKNESGDTWDADTICGIPVLHSWINVNSGYDGDDYFFHPIFNKERTETQMDIYYFQKGFKELI